MSYKLNFRAQLLTTKGLNHGMVQHVRKTIIHIMHEISNGNKIRTYFIYCIFIRKHEYEICRLHQMITFSMRQVAILFLHQVTTFIKELSKLHYSLIMKGGFQIKP